MADESHSIDRQGLFLALGAHAIWGSMPVYLLLVKQVPAVEFVAWRVIITLPICLAFIFQRKLIGEMRGVLRDRKTMLSLLGSALLVGANWLIYVWAIQHDHVYAASIGYYILPLLMMLLGLIVLREKMSVPQWIAVGLAAIAVTVLALEELATLWVSLGLASSFALYGLLRKTVAARALVGLTLESIILMPIAAVIALIYAAGPDGSSLTHSWGQGLSIALGGPMTAIPLLCFAAAARRLPMVFMGFLQFLSPTIVFGMGLFVFHEELHIAQLLAFLLIWSGVGLFIWHQWKSAKSRSALQAARKT